MKAIDLFAGAGGLSLGLKIAGLEIVGAIEHDSAACRTYRHNHGDHVFEADISDFGPLKMEQHLRDKGAIRYRKEIDLVVGGPPCPGFSLIGRSKISNLIRTGVWEGSDHRHAFIDDPRNKLFLEFVAYVQHFRPTYLIMENVQGMTSFKRVGDASIIDVVRLEFESLGYAVEVQVLDAADYGVPQHRRRVIFLGSRRKSAGRASFPLPFSGSSITVDDAIGDLPPIDPSTGRTAHESSLSNATHPFQRSVRAKGRVNKIDREALSSHITRPVNPRDVAMFPLLKSGANGGSRVLYRDLVPHRLSEIAEALPEGYHLIFEEERPFVVGPKWRGRAGRWCFYDPSKFGDKMRRIRPDRPAPTMVAHLAKDGYMFIHPKENRTITVREAARFQSFPDEFDFSAGGTVSMSSQFRQVGNAVPPLLGKRLGQAVLEANARHAAIYPRKK